MTTETEIPADIWRAEDYRPTKPQWEAAFLLARSYGHEWSSGWVNEGGFVARTLGQVASSTKKRREGMGFLVIPGIGSPCALGPGNGHPVGTLSHTTATGRLTWDILPSGMVELTIERSSGKPAISAIVRPHPTLGLHANKASAFVSDEAFRGQYHARHVEALRQALVALVCTRKAKAALKQATAWAMPDATVEVADQ